MGGDESSDSLAGGPAHHHPVLRAEVLAALQPSPGKIILDGTFGAGGYSRALLAQGADVVALDRDPSTALAAGAIAAEYPDRFTFHQKRFGDLEAAVGHRASAGLDGIVFDIGVSSMQLDQADRGFSFRNDGPLDMRMDRDGSTAADLVNGADETTLAAILFRFGEERDSRRIARAVVHDRVTAPFLRTRPLAELIERVVRNSPKGVHPATKTFQALRIAVNDELGQLLAGLAAAERALKPGGILAVVTFHSLEDRIVKRFFGRASGRAGGGSRHQPTPVALEPSFTLAPGQPVLPGAAELDRNPRSRSAKLRWGTRSQAEPLGLDTELQSLADLGLRTGRR